MSPRNEPARVGLRNPRIAPNGMDRNRKTTLAVCSGAPLLGKLLTHIEVTPLVISARRAKVRGIDRNVDRQ